MSKARVSRLMNALLGVGWYPIPHMRFDMLTEWSWNYLRQHGGLRSLTGDITFAAKADIKGGVIWAHKSQPRLAAMSPTYYNKAFYGTYHDDEIAEDCPMVQAPITEMDKYVPDSLFVHRRLL